MYTHLVLAVPHAVGRVSLPEVAENTVVQAEVERWTDWYTDELFSVEDERISTIQFPYSRIEVDAERLKGEVDRIAAYTLPTKGNLGGVASSQRNLYLAAWFQYRANLLMAAARGEQPLIIDCHSFPSDLDKTIDVCLGFNEDASKPSEANLQGVAEIFSQAGYRVAFNIPYSNAIAPVDYCGHSLMIELNKQTYMDESERFKGVGYESMRAILLKVYAFLLGVETL